MLLADSMTHDGFAQVLKERQLDLHGGLHLTDEGAELLPSTSTQPTWCR